MKGRNLPIYERRSLRHFISMTLQQVYKPKGARGGVVVKALRYKPTGRGFDSRWCHWSFSVT
jgi:hypothetical protein